MSRQILQQLWRVPAHLAIALVVLYQLLVSPVLHAFGGGGCRFHPTCSRYAVESLRVHGFLVGTLLTVWRLLRCHPWGGTGEDPVPLKGNWSSAFKRKGQAGQAVAES